jgi:D-amino-acid dehydrogenase
MSRDTVVLGAGMVGVSIAWHLARRGHSVLLVDRRPPGRETSYGNGGLIQREAVRPYTFPRQMGKLLSSIPNRRVDIRYQMSGMFEFAAPLFGYWRCSAPRQYERIIREYASLIELSTQEHAPMIEAAGAGELIGKEGWLEVHRSQAELDLRRHEAEDSARRFRCDPRDARWRGAGPKEPCSEAGRQAPSTGPTPGAWPIRAPWSLPMPTASCSRGGVSSGQIQELSQSRCRLAHRHRPGAPRSQQRGGGPGAMGGRLA